MRTAIGWALMLGVAAVIAGCEATAQSDRCEPGWQTTASYDKIKGTPGSPSPIKNRDWPETNANYEAPVVTHFGSYLEDPLVTKGDQNDTYGWTCMDLLGVVYSPSRYIVNLVAIPVSMVKEPPCVLQCRNLDQELPECGADGKTAACAK